MTPEDLFKPDDESNLIFRYKLGHIYISEKYHQILFVPLGGIVEEGIRRELPDIIADKWPCDFGNLQINIEEMLNRFKPLNIEPGFTWPAYEASLAKTRKSFEQDYLMLRLESDSKNPYGEGEAERINVRAQASRLETSYYLIGQEQLIDTELAQVVIDIFNACMKIRS